MRILSILLASGIFVTAGFAASPENNWHPANGPLMTRWAKDVSPANAWPEYPRPQLVRKEWMNLNGLWYYAMPEKAVRFNEMYDQIFSGTILVPYPIESALSGVMQRLDENHRLWYQRTFTLPKKWKGQRVLLHFGAVDWETAVYINRKKVGEHRGGYDPFSFDITDALNESGSQEILVSVFDPTEGGQPRGKQVRKPHGIFYTPCSGIWQTVWLEPVPSAHIAELKITPNVDNSSVKIEVTAASPKSKGTIHVSILDGGKTIYQADVEASPGADLLTETVILPVPNAKLWSPDSPFLYNVEVNLSQRGRAVDKVSSYFGMRKIALGKDEKGITRPMLNGKFLFEEGPLDQGFWPDGIYTAPTKAAMDYDLEITKQLGFNMVRKHVKVEPELWYYWCDKNGLLVWQDMPSGDNRTPEDKQNFESELKHLIETHYNHPSIVMWVVFNEGWGQYDTERLTKWVKDFDPSRLVDNATGWTDKNCGDVIDMHKYPGPGSPSPEPNRAAVLGEFGGLGLPLDGHTWTQQSWGYQSMSGQNALTRRYLNLLRQVYELKDSPGLSAIVYTQTTDVETEVNGLMTYDRAVIKPDAKKVADANHGIFPPEPKRTIVLPTSQKEGAIWEYSFEKPTNGCEHCSWYQTDFKGMNWKRGPAGFGTAGTPGAVVRTEWNTSDIWMRREFDLSTTDFNDLVFSVHHDEDAEIYLNGILAAKAKAFTTDYEDVEINSRAKSALKVGKNFLAVHCHQTGGGQYIDVGLVSLSAP